MVREEIENGFENVVDVLKENIAKIEEAQIAEIEEATKEIKAKYEFRLNRYKEELSHLVMTYEVEDEPETVADETETEHATTVNFTEAP